MKKMNFVTRKSNLLWGLHGLDVHETATQEVVPTKNSNSVVTPDFK